MEARTYNRHLAFSPLSPHGVDEASVGAVRELLLEAHGAALGAASLGNLVVRPGCVPRQSFKKRGEHVAIYQVNNLDTNTDIFAERAC